MVSSIRDPLDRLVTRREAHAIAVKVLEQMLSAMAKAQKEHDDAALGYTPEQRAMMAEQVRAGG